jgi:polyhydroxyalkanoate synthesis regulator phasin
MIMPNTPEMWLQQGFRVALGFAGTLVELVQDEQKRQTQLHQWQADMEQLVQELIVKGEKTEAEAREFVERLFNRTSPPPASPPPPVEVEVTSAPAEAAAELQELTQELSSLRESLEQSRPGE